MPENKRHFDPKQFEDIKNRNENRVWKMMETVVPIYSRNYKLRTNDYSDIYAWALNHLPARYARASSVILENEVTDEQIREVIEDAIMRVVAFPRSI